MYISPLYTGGEVTTTVGMSYYRWGRCNSGGDVTTTVGPLQQRWGRDRSGRAVANRRPGYVRHTPEVQFRPPHPHPKHHTPTLTYISPLYTGGDVTTTVGPLQQRWGRDRSGRAVANRRPGYVRHTPEVQFRPPHPHPKHHTPTPMYISPLYTGGEVTTTVGMSSHRWGRCNSGGEVTTAVGPSSYR